MARTGRSQRYGVTKPASKIRSQVAASCLVNSGHDEFIAAISEVSEFWSMLVLDRKSRLLGAVQYRIAVAVEYRLLHGCRQGLDDETISLVLAHMLGQQVFVVLVRQIRAMRVAVDARAIRIKHRHAAMRAARVATSFPVILPFNLHIYSG